MLRGGDGLGGAGEEGAGARWGRRRYDVHEECGVGEPKLGVWAEGFVLGHGLVEGVGFLWWGQCMLF